MTRDEVLELIRDAPGRRAGARPGARSQESTHFREDLTADSLDLYTLVQELEDTYGVKMSDEQAARIQTVGAGGGLRARPTDRRRGPDRCASSTTCSSGCRTISPGRRSRTRRGPSGGRTPTSGWPSWATPCSALAVTTHLYPRLEADAYGAGRLTKIRAQAVSGPLLPRGRGAARASRSGCAPRRRRRSRGPATEQLARTERVLASVIEAVIGACYLAFGYEETADGGGRGVPPEIEQALDASGGLQVGAAGAAGAARDGRDLRGRRPRRARRTSGPSRWSAMVDGEEVARGSGRSKKDAEQAAAEAALETDGGVTMHLSSITLKGFKSFPDRTRLDVLAGRVGDRRARTAPASPTSPTPCCGRWASSRRWPCAAQSMQDVIFAGAHGVQARCGGRGRGGARQRATARVDLPGRRGLDLAPAQPRGGGRVPHQRRHAAGSTDVIEILSDTGLGKEMHSVVSQGRVEAIVTSKPRDRRMLIEEAAGLGKHRKRRRRAQLKLERTQDNLDRALDVEREARTRLKPLKRQAEAAELHERLERQIDEARWTLAARRARAPARAALAAAEAAVAARARRGRGDRGRAGARSASAREAAEEALAARGSEREALSQPLLRRALGGRADRAAAGGRAAQSAASWRERAARRRGAIARAARPRPPRTPATTAPPSGSPRCEAELAAARRGPPGAPGARARRARGAPRGRGRGASPSAPRAAERRRRARGARPTPPPRPPAAPAASSTPPPSAPAASPPASAPSSPRSTSSCAPTPARRAARRRSPTR